VLEPVVTILKERWPRLEIDPRSWLVGLKLAEHDRRLPHLSDLYLAHCCSFSNPVAVEYFEREFLTRAMTQLGSVRLDSLTQGDVHSEVRDLVLLPPSGRRGRLAEYQGLGPLLGWVKVVATRVALRRKQPEKEVLAAAGDSSVLVAGDLELDWVKRQHEALFRRALREALKTLQTHDVALLRLHYGEHVSMEALGAMYRVHRSSVSRAIQKARTQIADFVYATVKAELRIIDNELDSLMTLFQSRLENSLAGWLARSPLEDREEKL
jgi:RNA polymerase sigma-70 factor (ECF subfamily)